MQTEKEFMDTINYGEIEEIYSEYIQEHIKSLSFTLEYFDALYRDNGLTELKTVNRKIKSTIKALMELGEKMEKHIEENALNVELTITLKHLDIDKENTRDYITKIATELKPVLEGTINRKITAKINGEVPPRNNWGVYGWENL